MFPPRCPRMMPHCADGGHGMMKLHWSPRSPYVRKVMVVAHELGLAHQIKTVRTVVGGSKPHLELMRENPLGKIPTLVLEDGTIIYDSPVICEYLDTLHDGPKLFPAWPERLVALRRLALGDGMLDIALAWLSERFRPAADPLTIGHIAIGIALSYLDFRFDDLRWRDGRPHLAAWHATFNARASV